MSTISLLTGSLFMVAGVAHAAAIFIMRVDGTEVRKVAQVEGCGGHGSPRFSHDDKRLVFDAGPGGTNTYRFFVVNIDGTGLQEMGAHAMPDLSPDDKQVAYHNYGGNAQAGVHVQNLDSQGNVFLTEGGSPRWSPDGSQIALTDWRTVKLLDLVEGEQRVLVDERFEGYQIGFDWSPDGKRLAFVGKRNNQEELWIADTEPGSQRSRVRFTGDLSSHVAWSHDGRRLAITIDGKINLLEADGTKGPEPIPRQEGRNGDVAWSHDGKWIAFSSDRQAPGRPQAADKPVWKMEELPRQRRGAPAYCVALSSDGRRAVLGGYTGKAGFQLWDIGQDRVTSHNFPAVFLTLAPNDRVRLYQLNQVDHAATSVAK
jgi:Tol biopolymer transport system component